ncbi:hypothetical protein IAT40_004786 [Kwoniella sp. CBS 6097]
MSPPYTIIDQYNLTISLLITIAWQVMGFAIAWTFKFDKITDFTGGSNFFILTLITLTTGGSELSTFFPMWVAIAALSAGSRADYCVS